ncbi:hypothetical protein M5K25_004198 [Dendrobium thyrsiflorum]|uniref:Replication factor A C-terminal domain-containing protein n=1 Tax=Dendrobium thyrsiflorum TaxID=117978 RepID=A0ABD0VTT4_DENTH
MEASTLIKNLTLHQRYWTIIVVLTEMDTVRNFKSGQGKIQKLTFMDNEGSQIYGIMFNEIIDKFHDILEIGQTYVISNGQIKDINKTFYNVHEKFEIILNNLSEIHVAVNHNIQSLNKKLSTIEDIMSNPNLPSDIILLVLKVHETRTIYRQRDKKSILKRDLQVIGLRSEVITLTLWESLATKEGKQLEDMMNEKPIIFVKGVVGKNFNGFTLSSTISTIIEINPDLPTTKEMMDWFNETGYRHASSNFDAYLVANLLKINTSELSLGEMKYYATKVIIKGLQQEENIWYPSCNTCKSRVTITKDIVRCSKCSKENAAYSLRYLIKLYVEDETSNAIFTLFDNEAESIIGVPVSELEKIKVTDIEEYNKIIKNSCDKEMTFIIKAQDKIYGNRTFRSLTVQSIKEDSYEINNTISKKIKLEEK